MSSKEYIKVEMKEHDDIFLSISGGDLKKKMSQNVAMPLKCILKDEDVAKPLKSNSEDEDNEDVAKTLKLNSEDEDIFKSICGGDLKKKFSQIATNTFKSKSVDVHITGPFHKSGKSHWVIVYGDCGKAYVLKAQFILVYVSCLLRDWEKVKKTKVNIDHCNTYYETGICKFEFGPENL
jgi:hypothetical protein